MSDQLEHDRKVVSDLRYLADRPESDFANGELWPALIQTMLDGSETVERLAARVAELSTDFDALVHRHSNLQDSIEAVMRERDRLAAELDRRQALWTQVSLAITRRSTDAVREQYKGNTPEWICGEIDGLTAIFAEHAAALAELARVQASIVEQRGVTEGRTCVKCGGLGTRAYGSTATWRGDIGGQQITLDVCDRCWGSGDETRRWPSHRLLSSVPQLVEAAYREAHQLLDSECTQRQQDAAWNASDAKKALEGDKP